MKKKWMVFAAAVLFLAAAGLGLYLGAPAIPKRNREQAVPVQSVASLTGYAESEALRSRFLGILTRKEAVSVQLDSGRENGGFLVETGDLVEEGAALAVYDNASLLLDREQLLLDREQLAFDVENANLRIRTLRQERSQAEAAQKGDYDLQILHAEAELSQKDRCHGRDPVGKGSGIALQRSCGGGEPGGREPFCCTGGCLRIYLFCGGGRGSGVSRRGCGADYIQRWEPYPHWNHRPVRDRKPFGK